MHQPQAMEIKGTPGTNRPEKLSWSSPLTRVPPITILACGVIAWMAGATTDISRAELITQPLFIAGWLLFVVRVYQALLNSLAVSRTLGIPASWSERLRLISLVALLVPVLVVTETWIKWTVNDMLYDTTFTLPVFRGLLRGVFEQVIPPGHPAFGLDPVTGGPLLHQLSAFAHLLGFVEEIQPYAAAAASPMIGDVIWAVVATTIGTGRLRQTSPLLARAFRIVGLMAATAPLFTMIYFLVFGGDGVNGWYSVFGSLLGQVDDGTWLPMWIRVTGAGIFFLLPPLIVHWQLRTDVIALGAHPRSIDRHASAVLASGSSPERESTWLGVFASALIVSMLAFWASNLVLGTPYFWSVQSVWLLLWFCYLEWIYRALCRLTPEGETRRRADSSAPSTWRWRVVAAAVLLALTVGNLVVQVGGQWLVASAHLGASQLDVEFFGWFLGQVRTAPGVALPPAAIGVALLGNAVWATALLWLGSTSWRSHDPRMPRLLRLGALQAATTPLALAQYLILSILTKVERHRLSGHLPAVDLWGTWSYVMGRPIEGAMPRYQSTPEWLVLTTLLLGLLAMPVGFFALRLRIERRWRRPSDRLRHPAHLHQRDCSIVQAGEEAAHQPP